MRIPNCNVKRAHEMVPLIVNLPPELLSNSHEPWRADGFLDTVKSFFLLKAEQGRRRTLQWYEVGIGGRNLFQPQANP